MLTRSLMCSLLMLSVSSGTAQAQPRPSRAAVLDSLQNAVQFYRSEVSAGGGYLWRYSSDFSEREGELPASPTTVWVQPSGTPTVGMAYLTAWELTADPLCLNAVRETALALVKGQLESGGWDYRIEFAPEDRAKYAYRVDTGDKAERRNVTTLDDNTTQAALTFLMMADRALKFKDKSIHEAAKYALTKLLEAQYPNGAWPQRFSAPGDPQQFPVLAASYPETWSRDYPAIDYRSYYTFNDNTMADAIELMFLASEIYDEEEYAAAGRRGGEFILLAQMPEPQPGWAQQYDAQMHPAWARKFEPPGVTGAESQRVMETLLRLFELTGDRRFLEPLPRALDYFRRSQINNEGQLARFYELRTNRPLYFTKKYELTYNDDDLPTHYGFKATSRLAQIQQRLDEMMAVSESEFMTTHVLQPPEIPPLTSNLTAAVQRLLETQDQRGAWVEPAYFRARSNIPRGTPSLSSRTFARNIVTLSGYLAAMSQPTE